MTLITGTIRDSAGGLLSGKLTVTLDSRLIDADTTPNSVVVVEPHVFNVLNGAINATLPQSETQNTTYFFQFQTVQVGYTYYFADGSIYGGPVHLHTDEQYYTGVTHTAQSVVVYRQVNEALADRLSFHAIVPNTSTCEFSDLVETGITTDILDSSIRRLALLLTSDQQFVNTLRGGPRYLGVYNPATYYQRDDNVSYAKSSWTYINETPTAGKTPSVGNSAYWQLAAAQGEPGGTGGTDTAYDATGWDGALWAPSANALRDKIETLATLAQLGGYAPLASPNFTGNPTAPTQAAGNSTDRLATTNFVGTAIAAIGKVPIGAVLSWITNSPPSKWVICDGRAISRTTYGDLFTVIGTTFGSGDGSTTFNLPDLRGRVPVGPDSTTLAGAATRVTTGSGALAGTGGAERVTLGITEIPAHQHGLQTQLVAASGAVIAVPNNSTGNTTVTQAIGGGNSHQNMPPYLCLHWIIYAGV